jgi:xylulokinase
MGLFLGVDVGTSACKAVVVDEGGTVRGRAQAGYPLLEPAPTWAEQDPRAWWDAFAVAVRGALADAGVRGREVAAVGLTGQMHGMVALDARDEPVRPAIIWCDQRSAGEAEALAARVGSERVVALVGNPPLPNFTVTKLLWLRAHEPERWAEVRSVLLPKDYVRLRLTGVRASDVSDASGTLAFDVGARAWSREMAELVGIPLGWWPPVAESPEVVARVSDRGAEATGLAPGTPVVAGAGDQAAAAVGTGTVAPGVVSVTIGTSGVVFAPTAGVVRDARGRLHTFCHAVPGTWHVMGVTQAAGGSLAWWRRALGEAEEAVARATGEDVYDVLGREAAAVPPLAEGLVFLPYLMGERTPHTDPYARGVFFGLTPRHGRGHFVRAILEGVSQSLADCLELIEGLGAPVGELRLTGGGARSALWRQIQADVFGRPVRVVQGAEGPATGAAVLAAVGAGAYASVPEAAQAMVHPGPGTAPDPEAVARYREHRALYRALYQALRPVFPR